MAALPPIHRRWVVRTCSMSSSKESSSKRELLEPHPGDKRFVRRDSEGKFSESDDVGKSLAADQRTHAETESEKGQGDKGDRKS